ncbi:hypothetical protein ACFFTT_45325, partial [Actinoplanes octamycinicus]
AAEAAAEAAAESEPDEDEDDWGPPPPPGEGPWAATLTLREAVGDEEAVLRADLLLVQPLREAEAQLVGDALELGDTTRLLGRMRPGMLGVLSPPAVRWAMLAPTPVEKVLIGDLERPMDER